MAKKVTRKIIKKKTTDDAILKMFESINSKMDTNNAQMFSLNKEIKNQVMKLDVKLDSKINELQQETSMISKLASSSKGDILDLVAQSEGFKNNIIEIDKHIKEMNIKNCMLEKELNELKTMKTVNVENKDNTLEGLVGSALTNYENNY